MPALADAPRARGAAEAGGGPRAASKGPLRLGAGASLSLLGGFVALVAAGGVLNPGYNHADDFLSSLASYGAVAPGLGVSALLALAGAHAAAAYGVRRGTALVLVPFALALSAAAVATIASFRLHCAGGPAGCYVRDSSGSALFTDVVHGRAVAVYQATIMLAMGGLAWEASRAKAPRRLVAPSAAAALGSFSIFALMGAGGPHPGATQRAWVFVNSLWLLGSLLVLTRSAPSPSTAVENAP
jgi:hypothetical protein